MRKLIIIAFTCVAVLVAGYGGYRGYKIWKQHRFLGMAKEFLAKGDGRNALLTLNQLLRSNPRNLEATRMMADLAAAARSPAVLIWRSRVVELAPGSTEDRLLLTSTALSMQNIAIATNALAGVSATDRQTFGYQNLAGNVAARLDRVVEAEQHFIEAVRLQPTNPAPVLSLAVLRLQTTNALALGEARATLNRLRSDPIAAPQALRELVSDAMRQARTNDALAYSRELVSRTNTTLGDELLHLDVLFAAHDRGFRPALSKLQGQCTNSPGAVREVANWQASRTGPGEALAWLRTLPPAFQTNQSIALVVGECLIAVKDWKGAQATLQGQHWAELEFLRHAFMARAMRGLNLATSAKTEWDQALKQASLRKESLAMLLRLCDASQWNWPNEGEEILQAVLNRFPTEKWAFGLLARKFFSEGRTRSLLTLYGQESKANPSDVSLKNNLAMTALLLEANELKPHDLAREVYDKAPTNATCVSTYALSLYLQRKPADALKLIQQIPPAELENPSISGYYGMLLQAAGDRGKAAKYFELAAKAPLLPEERKLIDSARRKL